MLKIEQEWDTIEKALRGAVTLVSAFGYSRDTLTANYTVIPIAYYLKSKCLPNNFDLSAQYTEDRKAIQRWLVLALVKRVFGGVPDSVLRPMREVLSNPSNVFPLVQIIDKFKGTNKSLVITEDDVENMLSYRYGQAYTFSTLTLLYPSFDFRNRFHIDHIHPRSHFTRAKLRNKGIPEADIEFYVESVDALPNLQLLEGIPNQEKSDTDFDVWLADKYDSQREKTDYMNRHLIPETNHSLSSFRSFFEEREKKIKDELCSVFGITFGK
jgi:hypothetical protein